MTRPSSSTLATLTAAAVTVSGCAQGLPGLRPVSYASPGEARIFVSKEPCVHDAAGKEAAGLIAGIAVAAVSTLLDNFGTALKDGAAGGALPTVTAVRNLTLEPGRVPGCVTMVRGSFDTGARSVDWTQVLGVDLRAGGEKRKRFDSLGIPPMSRLDQIVELAMVEGPGKKAMTYFPVFTRIERSLDGARSGKRDLTIALKFSRPGMPDAGGPVLLSGREIGRSYTDEIDPGSTRAKYEAPWFAFPNGLPAPAPKADSSSGQAAAAADGGITGGAGIGGAAVAQRSADSQEVDPFFKGATAVPLTVTVTTVETRPTNQALAFVASVFTAVKPQVAGAVAPLLNADVAAAQDQSLFAAQSEYAAALGAARSAVLAYCESTSTEATVAGRTDRYTKSAAASAAQLKANAAAIKASSPPPFASIVAVSDAIPVATSEAACRMGN